MSGIWSCNNMLEHAPHEWFDWYRDEDCRCPGRLEWLTTEATE